MSQQQNESFGIPDEGNADESNYTEDVPLMYRGRPLKKGSRKNAHQICIVAVGLAFIIATATIIGTELAPNTAGSNPSKFAKRVTVNRILQHLASFEELS